MHMLSRVLLNIKYILKGYSVKQIKDIVSMYTAPISECAQFLFTLDQCFKSTLHIISDRFILCSHCKQTVPKLSLRWNNPTGNPKMTTAAAWIDWTDSKFGPLGNHDSEPVPKHHNFALNSRSGPDWTCWGSSVLVPNRAVSISKIVIEI